MGSTPHYRRIPFVRVLVLPLAGLTACASAPPAPQQPVSESVAVVTNASQPRSRAQRGLAIARDMVGMPYRYGGANPRGFDCSGLVYYSYRKAGFEVPRTTGEQYRESKRVALSSLRPGDLLFFSITRDRLSHVGIYAGNGRFIHAPSGGKRVSYASLDNPYWEIRLLGAGRLH